MEREVNFNILKNGEGNLMFLVHARVGGVSSSKIVYDGGQMALLYRTKEDIVALDFIHPAIRADLKKKNLVICVNEEVRKGRLYKCTDLGKEIIKKL